MTKDIEEYIERVVAEAPPFTEVQRSKLAALFGTSHDRGIDR